MNYLEVGLITKGVKTVIIGVFLVIIFIQMIITKNKSIKDTKILFFILILLNLGFNIFELLTIPKTDSLVLPTIDPYSGWNMIRYIFIVTIGVFLIFLLIRLIFYKKKRVLGNFGKKEQYASRFGHETHCIRPIVESSDRGLAQEINQSNVDIQFIVITMTIFMCFIFIRNIFRPYLADYGLLWEIFELVDIIVWIFLGISMLMFKNIEFWNFKLVDMKMN